MKNSVLYLLLTITLLCFVPQAQGAFFVKKAATETSILATTSASGQAATVVSGKHSTFLGRIKESVSPSFYSMTRRGWIGMASTLFGILGFIHPLFAIIAVIFGFIGMSRKNWRTGFAIAGFLLGVIAIAISAFAL